MALRAAAAATTPVAPRGLRALFSTFSPNFPFNQPQAQVEKQPPAEPSTNLFVSGELVPYLLLYSFFPNKFSSVSPCKVLVTESFVTLCLLRGYIGTTWLKVQYELRGFQ